MKWKTLKNKYPELWDKVYNGMIEDLINCMDGPDIIDYEANNKSSRIKRIAHNAAFLACYALHSSKL